MFLDTLKLKKLLIIFKSLIFFTMFFAGSIPTTSHFFSLKGLRNVPSLQATSKTLNIFFLVFF